MILSTGCAVVYAVFSIVHLSAVWSLWISGSLGTVEYPDDQNHVVMDALLRLPCSWPALLFGPVLPPGLRDVLSLIPSIFVRIAWQEVVCPIIFCLTQKRRGRRTHTVRLPLDV